MKLGTGLSPFKSRCYIYGFILLSIKILSSPCVSNSLFCSNQNFHVFFYHLFTEIIKRINKFGNLYLCVYFLQFSYLQNAINFSHLWKIDCQSKATKIRITILLVTRMWNEIRKNVNSTRSKCVIFLPLEHFIFLTRLGEKFCMIWGVYLQIHCSTIWTTLYGSIPLYTHNTWSTGFVQVTW